TPRPRSGETGDQDVTELRLPGASDVLPPLHRPSRGVEPVSHEVGDAVHPFGQERSALQVDQGFEIGEVLGEELLNLGAEVVEIEGGCDGIGRHSLATSWISVASPS